MPAVAVRLRQQGGMFVFTTVAQQLLDGPIVEGTVYNDGSPLGDVGAVDTVSFTWNVFSEIFV